jgi:hypothetical protein
MERRGEIVAWILIDRKLNRILNTPLFVALNMDIDTINALSDPLCRIHLATSSWDDGKLGDQEVYNACDEMHAICIAILTKLDDLLDEDEDGDSFDEDSSSELCVLFLSSRVVPTKENIKNLHPVMVMKTIVEALIRFLLEYNSWYSASGITLSSKNISALYEEIDAKENEQCIPAALDLRNLACEGQDNDPIISAGGYAEREAVFEA